MSAKVVQSIRFYCIFLQNARSVLPTTCPLSCRKQDRRSCKKLISKPYHNWKYATNDLRKHALCEYHKTTAVLIENFVLTAEDATARIDLTLDNKAKEQVDQNRKVQHSIIRRSIEFCGRKGIALQDHRYEDTIVTIKEETLRHC